ncbi:MAG: hypothetical protein ACYDG0_01450 [Vulcanimicrobiaceae bacterium]
MAQLHMGAPTTEEHVADMRAAYDWLAHKMRIPAERIAAVGYRIGGLDAHIPRRVVVPWPMR